MKLTIITVCYNAASIISKTIENVISQTYQDYEYIIIDGNSTDGTIEEIEKYTDNNKKIRFYSEPDFGIYNAMNRGVSRATGDFIYFINAGDLLSNNNVLENVALYLNDNRTIYFGYVHSAITNEIERDFYFKLTGNIEKDLLKGDMPCHQCVFAPRESLTNGYFNEQFKIRADYNWLCNAVLIERYKLEYMPVDVAFYDKFGFSAKINSVEIGQKETDKIINKYRNAESNKSDIDENVIQCNEELVMASIKNTVMYKWILRLTSCGKLYDSLTKHGYSRIGLFGFGLLGELLFTELMNEGANVVYVIENKDRTKHIKAKMITQDDEIPDADLLVVTPIKNCEDIRKQMAYKVNCPIMTIDEILNLN